MLSFIRLLSFIFLQILQIDFCCTFLQLVGPVLLLFTTLWISCFFFYFLVLTTLFLLLLLQYWHNLNLKIGSLFAILCLLFRFGAVVGSLRFRVKLFIENWLAPHGRSILLQFYHSLIDAWLIFLLLFFLRRSLLLPLRNLRLRIALSDLIAGFVDRCLPALQILRPYPRYQRLLRQLRIILQARLTSIIHSVGLA